MTFQYISCGAAVVAVVDSATALWHRKQPQWRSLVAATTRCFRVTLAAGPWLFEAWWGKKYINISDLLWQMLFLSFRTSNLMLPKSEITCVLLINEVPKARLVSIVKNAKILLDQFPPRFGHPPQMWVSKGRDPHQKKTLGDSDFRIFLVVCPDIPHDIDDGWWEWLQMLLVQKKRVVGRREQYIEKRHLVISMIVFF